MKFRLDIVAFALGLCLFAYLFGAYSAEEKLFTYPKVLEQAFTTEKVQHSRNPNFWQNAPFEETGVVRRGSSASDGVTFYVSTDEPGAKLVDLDGTVVHEWRKAFGEVWSDPPHVKDPVPDDQIRWRYAHMYSDGSLLAVYEGRTAVPHGYGLVKLDKSSNVVWRLPRRIHHHLEVEPDGTIYALSQGYRDLERSPIPDNPQFTNKKTSKILEDFVLRISPDGSVVERYPIADAIIESPFRDILQMFPSGQHKRIYNEVHWDPVHTNDVEVANEAVAEELAPVDRGDLLLSIRTLHTVAALAPDEGRIVWASRGIWSRQHDPDILEQGNLLVFDNLGNAHLGSAGPEGESRILEIEPGSNRVPWNYAGDQDNKLFSYTEGSQQLLPNDNLLITESESGQIFEVDRDGNVVWRFNNPAVRNKQGTRKVARVHAAKRYRRDALEFEPSQ